MIKNLLSGLSLVASMAQATPLPLDCPLVRTAHHALQVSSFTAERDFTLTINGTLKARQTALVSYSNGRVEREILTQELLDKNLVLEEEDSLSALAVPFDCSRLVRSPHGHHELTSPDEAERVAFELRDGESALRPLSWTNRETVRFLWKKLEIEAVATYRDFAWK